MEPSAQEQRTYDAFVEQKWIFIFVGFFQSKNAEYRAYLGFLLLLNIYMQLVAGYATFLVSKKDLVINALHMIFGSVFCSWCLVSKIIADRSISNMREKIRLGIYNYEREKQDSELIRIRYGTGDEIKKKANVISFMYTIGFFSNMVFFPISQYFLLNEDSSGVLNPYLPHVFYSPFDTNSILGYSCAYIMDFFFWLYMYTTSVIVNAVYISYTAQLKTDLRMLNYSIRNIQNRAYAMYTNNNDVDLVDVSKVDLFQKKEFQNCLYLCLRENVRHHQALLRFKQECQGFIGSILLNIFILASLIYATIIYCLFQRPPINILVNYALTNMAEQTYTFFICFFGEEVIGEVELIVV